MRAYELIKQWRDDLIMITAACAVLAILSYGDFLEKRRKRSGRL